MSRRSVHKAIFERRIPKQDHFSAERETWSEVCREYVQLEPLSGRELFQAQQIQSKVTTKAKAIYSITLAAIDSACRMKIARPTPVDEENPTADANYRIFHIEQVINVDEGNRELQLMLQEMV